MIQAPARLDDLISPFMPISLTEMDEEKLMERMDNKFIFHERLLDSILSGLESHYRVLEIEDKRLMSYRTVYFDTDKLRLYHMHHAGKLNRFKVRYREYQSTGGVFFEVKQRNNKGRTQKKRMQQAGMAESLAGEAMSFLEERTSLKGNELSPSLWIQFIRVTLVNPKGPERVTIDTDLHYHMNGKECTFPGLAIAESKQARHATSAFMNRMKELHVRRGSMSKYCIGIATLNPEVRHNRFKMKMIHINKIVHGTSAGS